MRDSSSPATRSSRPELRRLVLPPRERGLRGGEPLGQTPALVPEALDLLLSVVQLARETLGLLVQLGVDVRIVGRRRCARTRTAGEAHRLLATAVALDGGGSELLILLGQQRLGGRELRPLLLELGEQARLLRGRLRLVGTPVVHAQVLVGRDGFDQRRTSAPALALVPTLNLTAQARAEAGLGLQLDAVLRGERARQLRPRDEAALDDGLPEPLAGACLHCERGLELRAREEPLLDEDATERSPRDEGRFHIRSIGAKGR